MGRAWNKETYARSRARLVERMGGKCTKCGSTENLTFGHVPGTRDWVANEVNRMTRLKLYRRDLERGILFLECFTCNLNQPKKYVEKEKE